MRQALGEIRPGLDVSVGATEMAAAEREAFLARITDEQQHPPSAGGIETVLAVERFTPEKGMSAGLHLQVKTDGGTISVHLGPEWYMERQDVAIGAKDRIEVRGSRVTFEGKPAIIAAEVRKGDQTLTLRDASGFLVWSGWRRR